jgi:roadblock/LC7 domain-containing protein
VSKRTDREKLKRIEGKLHKEKNKSKFYMEKCKELAIIGARMCAHIQMMRSMLGADKSDAYERLISDFSKIKATKPEGANTES